MKTLKSQVEHCLQTLPETRNSDITLTIAIWKRFYEEKLFKDEFGATAVRVRDLMELPREDNIKRIRAQFNAKGQYMPTVWKVAKQRGFKETEWRNFLGYPVNSWDT